MKAPSLTPQIKRHIRSLTLPPVPPHVRANFRRPDQPAVEHIAQSLKQHYFAQPQKSFASTAEAYLATTHGRHDLQHHLFNRLEDDRRLIIPWLDQARPLKGAHILEIGCGTGSSTVALAEQGATVVGVDIDEHSIAVAQNRCEALGLTAHFLKANATDVHLLLSNRSFDFIIFFAALEYMTHSERMSAMKHTWDMLPQGGFWCVVETPNRLWYFDSHTAHLPFYSWLPDDLAFDYSAFSPRPGFQSAYGEDTAQSKLDFLRRGRGVSYHEFDLTMKKAEHLKIISSLPLHLRQQSLLRRMKWKRSIQHDYAALLAKVGPAIHPGFYQPDLYLIIEKD